MIKTPAEMAKEIKEFFSQPGFWIDEKLLETIHTCIVAAQEATLLCLVTSNKLNNMSDRTPAEKQCLHCENEESETFHTCPYLCDIKSDDKSLCKCCKECTQECANDV